MHLHLLQHRYILKIQTKRQTIALNPHNIKGRRQPNVPDTSDNPYCLGKHIWVVNVKVRVAVTSGTVGIGVRKRQREAAGQLAQFFPLPGDQFVIIG